MITPSKNLWHCLGACNAGGSSIDWVMKAQGLSFRHAVELLRADLPSLGASSPVRAVKRSTVKRMDPPVEMGADDRALLSQVVEYYHETFKGSLEAQGYLRRRGLVCSEMADAFRIGFANRTLGYRLPDVSLWLSAARKARRKVPEPIAKKKFKGRFPLRIPEDVRRRLELEAKRRGISLNELILQKIA
ncbi:MAG: hypothetical protein Kow00128_09030 [Deltaproteobacteria bacterium]